MGRLGYNYANARGTLEPIKHHSLDVWSLRRGCKHDALQIQEVVIRSLFNEVMETVYILQAL